MEQALPYIWLALIIVTAIVEGVTTQLVSIWFTVGAVAGFLGSLFGAPLWLQLVLFAAVTAVTLAATRPLVKKMIHFKKEDTNAGRCIGKEAIVLHEINNQMAVGQVTVLGSVWTALSDDGSIVPAGSKVLIKKIEGVKLIVQPLY